MFVASSNILEHNRVNLSVRWRAEKNLDVKNV